MGYLKSIFRSEILFLMVISDLKISISDLISDLKFFFMVISNLKKLISNLISHLKFLFLVISDVKN